MIETDNAKETPNGCEKTIKISGDSKIHVTDEDGKMIIDFFMPGTLELKWQKAKSRW